MISYYGYTISPNQIETGEGFLICRNVPIARTGEQEYLASEIGRVGRDIITVHRTEDEVFSEAALASFEGKPVTNDHLPELLNPDNVTSYIKGHAERIRKGSGEWEGYVIADLHIQDRDLIREVQNGKREISCGYECEYMENEDGTYNQKNIRGNHIAVVTCGRAGKRAAILDLDTTKRKAEKPERKTDMKKGFWNLFGQAAEGKSAEEISQLAMDTAGVMEEVAPVQQEEKKENTPAVVLDDSAVDRIAEKVLEKLTERKKEEAKDSDPIEKTIAKLTGDEAGVVKEEEEETRGEENTCGMDTAAAVGILKSMRPVIAAIKDEEARMAVSDALIQCVTKQEEESDIEKIMKTARNHAKKAKDSMPNTTIDDIQKAYDNLNPHRKGNE